MTDSPDYLRLSLEQVTAAVRRSVTDESLRSQQSLLQILLKDTLLLHQRIDAGVVQETDADAIDEKNHIAEWLQVVAARVRVSDIFTSYGITSTPRD